MNADSATVPADEAGTGTDARKKPGRDHKTIAITEDAYAELTGRAEDAGTDRKVVAYLMKRS